jgi:hypothetical protein
MSVAGVPAESVSSGVLDNALHRSDGQPRTRISCHASLDEAARAPFGKERRMNFAKATKFHRKSGGGAT